MVTMTATEFVRNFSKMLDRLEFAAEEIVITRNKHVVAKLIPGAAVLTAVEAFGDIFGILSDEDGEAWMKDSCEATGTLRNEMEDPWASS